MGHFCGTLMQRLIHKTKSGGSRKSVAPRGVTTFSPASPGYRLGNTWNIARIVSAAIRTDIRHTLRIQRKRGEGRACLCAVRSLHGKAVSCCLCAGLGSSWMKPAQGKCSNMDTLLILVKYLHELESYQLLHYVCIDLLTRSNTRYAVASNVDMTM